MGEVIHDGSTSATSGQFGAPDDRPSLSALVLVATLAAATVCQGAFTGAARWLVGIGLVAGIGLDMHAWRSAPVRVGRIAAAAAALAIWIAVRDLADGTVEGRAGARGVVGRCRSGRAHRRTFATTRPSDHRDRGGGGRGRGGCVRLGGCRLAHRTVGDAQRVDVAGVVDHDLPERGRCGHRRGGAPRDQRTHRSAALGRTCARDDGVADRCGRHAEQGRARSQRCAAAPSSCRSPARARVLAAVVGPALGAAVSVRRARSRSVGRPKRAAGSGGRRNAGRAGHRGGRAGASLPSCSDVSARR